jgi:hypothetical protein
MGSSGCTSVMMVRVVSGQRPDDDDLALMHAIGRERYPSQAQSPYGFVLVLADGLRWIARLLYRAVAWGWRKVVRRSSSVSPSTSSGSSGP